MHCKNARRGAWQRGGADLAGSREGFCREALLAAELGEAEPACGRRHAAVQRVAQHVDDAGPLLLLHALLELRGAPQQRHRQVGLQHCGPSGAIHQDPPTAPA